MRTLAIATTITALLTLTGGASAQYSPGPFPGPFTVPTSGTFQSIDLNGAAAPVGNYTFASVSANWGFDTASSQFANDMRMALTNAPVNGVGAVPGGVTRYWSGFSANGGAPTTGLASATPSTILWDVNLETPFPANGANPLFFAFRTNWLSGLPVKLSNIQITLSTSTPGVANETCGTAADITPTLAGALTAPETNVILPSVLAVGGSAAALGFPTFSCSPATITRPIFYKFNPPATAPYRFSTCTSNGTINSMANNIIGVFEEGPGGACAGDLTQVVCSTTTCTGGAQALPTVLDASKTYFVVIGRTGTSLLGGNEKRYQLRVDRLTPLPTCTNSETEPNDSKATANAVTLAMGGVLCGTTTGSSVFNPVGDVTSFDHFKVQLPTASGIKRYRLTPNSFTPGQTVELLGVSQSAGVIGTTLSVLQSTSFLPSAVTPKYVQFYVSGDDATLDARSVQVRIGGGPTTSLSYAVQLASEDVVPTPLSRSLSPGNITITTVGQTGASQIDTELWILDSNFNAIANYGNDDATGPSSLGSRMTRSFAVGTYYMALSKSNLSVRLSSPTDDNYRAGPVPDFAGVIAYGATTLSTTPANVGFKVTDSAGDVTTAAAVALWDVAFFRLEVASQRCNAADIAYDDGSPLPPVGVPGGVNNGVTEGDYNLFFGQFFDAGAAVDIANDDGTPLPPFGPLATNNGVTEGDYNLFFSIFFDGCTF